MPDTSSTAPSAEGQPAQTRPRLVRHILLYLLVGGVSVGIDVGILVLLHEALAVPLGIATTVAFATSLVANFVLNRTVMSVAGPQGFSQHALRYGSLVAANYGITLIVVTGAAHAGVSYLLAKMAVVAASTVWNFLLYRYWVFDGGKAGRRVPHGEGASQLDTISGPDEPMPRQVDDKVLVVIPAYNEQDSVGQVVTEVSTCLPGAGILVVDDGSIDATRERALASSAMVLTLPYNLGVGGAMRAGFRFALRYGFERVIQIDGDGQHDPRDATGLISSLHNADIVIGSRFSGHGSYDVRGPRRWAMSLLSKTLSHIAGTTLTDTTSGYRAAGPRAIRLFAENYPVEYLGDTVESIVLSARAGMVIRQIPVRMRPRAAGQASQTIVRSILYLIRALLAICFAGLRRDPQWSRTDAMSPRRNTDVIGSRL